MELSIPVHVRVDTWGQVLRTVLPRDQTAAPETRVRASPPDGNRVSPVVASQPLETLGLLSRDAVGSLAAFIQSDAEKLANALPKQLKQTITQDDVVVWQREARPVVEVPAAAAPLSPKQITCGRLGREK